MSIKFIKKKLEDYRKKKIEKSEAWLEKNKIEKKIILYGNGVELYINSIFNIENNFIDEITINIKNEKFGEIWRDVIKTESQFENSIIEAIKIYETTNENFNDLRYLISKAILIWIENSHKDIELKINEGIKQYWTRRVKDVMEKQISKDEFEKGKNNINNENILSQLEKIGLLLLKVLSYDLIITTNYENLMWLFFSFRKGIFNFKLKHINNKSYFWINEWSNLKNKKGEKFDKKDEEYLEKIFLLNQKINNFFKDDTIQKIKKTILLNNYELYPNETVMFVDGVDTPNKKEEIFIKENVSDSMINSQWKKQIKEKISFINSEKCDLIDIFGWSPNNDWFIMDNLDVKDNITYFLYKEKDKENIPLKVKMKKKYPDIKIEDSSSFVKN